MNLPLSPLVFKTLAEADAFLDEIIAEAEKYNQIRQAKINKQLKTVNQYSQELMQALKEGQLSFEKPILPEPPMSGFRQESIPDPHEGHCGAQGEVKHEHCSVFNCPAVVNYAHAHAQSGAPAHYNPVTPALASAVCLAESLAPILAQLRICGQFLRTANFGPTDQRRIYFNLGASSGQTWRDNVRDLPRMFFSTPDVGGLHINTTTAAATVNDIENQHFKYSYPYNEVTNASYINNDLIQQNSEFVEPTCPPIRRPVVSTSEIERGVANLRVSKKPKDRAETRNKQVKQQVPDTSAIFVNGRHKNGKPFAKAVRRNKPKEATSASGEVQKLNNSGCSTKQILKVEAKQGNATGGCGITKADLAAAVSSCTFPDWFKGYKSSSEALAEAKKNISRPDKKRCLLQSAKRYKKSAEMAGPVFQTTMKVEALVPLTRESRAMEEPAQPENVRPPSNHPHYLAVQTGYRY